METVTVMTPYLPDDERAQRLARLQEGEQELTELEQKTLEAIHQLQAGGRRITNRTVYKVVGGNFVRFTARIKELRQMGLLVSVSDGDTNDTN